jgi:hypothetical protein
MDSCSELEATSGRPGVRGAGLSPDTKNLVHLDPRRAAPRSSTRVAAPLLLALLTVTDQALTPAKCQRARHRHCQSSPMSFLT